MIAKPEWTQSNAWQNKDRIPTNNRQYIKQKINNNRTTALERTAAQASGGGGLNLFCWCQIFALDS